MATLKDFAGLKELGKQLKEQGQQRAVEKAEAEKAARKAQADANVFQDALAGVKAMPKSDRYEPKLPKAVAAQPAARPRTQAEDDAAVLRESMSDQFDVGHLMEEDPSASFLRLGVGQDVLKKLRKGHWPVDDQLDLHHMRRDEAREALGGFLRNAARFKFRCVCVIHGKGFGSAGGEPVLRSMVHSWLEQTDQVIAFCAARVDERSHGALLVLLRSAISPRA